MSLPRTIEHDAIFSMDGEQQQAHQIQLLERVLEMARAGRVSSLVIIAATEDGQAFCMQAVRASELQSVAECVLDAAETLAAEPTEGDRSEAKLNG